jgi:hypothetical protein
LGGDYRCLLLGEAILLLSLNLAAKQGDLVTRDRRSWNAKTGAAAATTTAPFEIQSPFSIPATLSGGGFGGKWQPRFGLIPVGAPGFEPGTSCPPDKRANQAAPRPERGTV